MATISASIVREAASRARTRTQKSDAAILEEARAQANDRYDVFLSHSRIDRKLVVGAKQLLEERGYSVYVDWIEDGEIDRAAVDQKRAELLRARMAQSDNLFYAHTPNAKMSRWCPWELGYFDALKKPDERVFVVPITESDERYEGQEYLSLYQTVDPRTFVPPPAARRDKPMDPLAARLLRDAIGFGSPMPGRRFL